MERREIDFLRSLVYFTEAKYVVEVGVQFGDVGRHLAKVAQDNGGKYVGFDLWGAHGQAMQFPQMGSKESVSNVLKTNGASNFELIQIDTINDKENFEKELDRVFPDGIDFAFIDGDHSYLGIANDFSVVYPRLNSRGVIAFHDTAVIDGCREFVYHLRNKYYDGTFDIIDFPFGSGARHCGLSILSKKSYHLDDVKIDEICGSISDPGEIEGYEAAHILDIIAEQAKYYRPVDIKKIKIKTDNIKYRAGRNKYE